MDYRKRELELEGLEGPSIKLLDAMCVCVGFLSPGMTFLLWCVDECMGFVLWGEEKRRARITNRSRDNNIPTSLPLRPPPPLPNPAIKYLFCFPLPPPQKKNSMQKREGDDLASCACSIQGSWKSEPGLRKMGGVGGLDGKG